MEFIGTGLGLLILGSVAASDVLSSKEIRENFNNLGGVKSNDI